MAELTESGIPSASPPDTAAPPIPEDTPTETPNSNIAVEEAQPPPAPPQPADDDPEDIAPNEFLALLPPQIQPRLAKLRELNSQREEVLTRYQVERAALEVKYADLMKPLYGERRGVVNGDFDEVLVKEAGDVEENAEDDGAEEDEGDIVKGIPQFWACAMGNMDVIAELITEEDVDCLEFLTDITCSDFPDGTGFELSFHFVENPYFTNSILTKRYEVPNLLTEDEPILKNVTGTTISWKSGQSLTFKQTSKKQRKKGGRGAGQIRTVTKQERCESFFHFFAPPKMPALADVVDEEEANAVEEAFDHDYDVAQAFRGCIIPKAVLWFTGEAMEEGYDEGMEDFIDDDGDDDDDDDDNDQDGGGGNEQAGQFQFKFDGGVGTGDTTAVGNAENPECKQS